MAFSRRSEPARAAILAAARNRFSQDGYEQTTIRSVASDAGVDPSMVMRYYQSKEGLFSAAVDVDLQLPDLAGVQPEQVAERLLRHFVSRWEGDAATEALMIVLRSAVTNQAGAERIRTVFAAQVVDLVRRVTHNHPDSELRAGLVSTQLLGIALTRYILRLPPIADLDQETLVQSIAPALDRILRPGRAGPSR